MNGKTQCFPEHAGRACRARCSLFLLDKLGGLVMPRRLVAFLKGEPDAVPGDYLIAIVAVFGIMFALLARMLY